MARPLPWFVAFSEDPLSVGRYEGEGRVVLRPLLEASLAARWPMTQKVLGLVDSGSEHTLAAPGLARSVGLEMRDAFREIPIGIGGEKWLASFLDVTVRLHHPDDPMEEAIEWRTEVGFLKETPKAPWSILLGQVGFLDHVTVTISRHAQCLAIEPLEGFDQRFSDAQELAVYPNLRFQG